MSESCKVCQYLSNDVTVERDARRDRWEVECPRCGHFYITDTCSAVLGNPSRGNGLLAKDIAKAAVGCWLREQQKLGYVPILDTNVVPKLAEELRFPSVSDQIEAVLQLVGEKSDGPGDVVDLDSFIDQYAVGASTENAIEMLVEQLESRDLVRAKNLPSSYHEGANFRTRLTVQGWLAFEELKRGKTSGRRAFMAMPFGKADLEPTWLDTLRAAVKATGFTLHRVDDNPKPGSIDDQIRLQIKQARFLIVELTHANNGAYWEAGYAEGLGKPVIYSCHKDHKPHFDVDHSLRIVWGADTMDDAAKLLKAVIRNAMPDATLDDDVAEA